MKTQPAIESNSSSKSPARASMVVAPREVPFAESLGFANTMMRIENPSLSLSDLRLPTPPVQAISQKRR